MLPLSVPKKQTQFKPNTNPISSKAKMSLKSLAGKSGNIHFNKLKKIWTIPKGTIKIAVLDKLSISGLY